MVEVLAARTGRGAKDFHIARAPRLIRAFSRIRAVLYYANNIGTAAPKRLHGLPYVGFNFHELRHTQATLLIGQGTDIKTVQHRLGHSSASLTMDVYAHAMPANDEAAARLMQDELSPGAGVGNPQAQVEVEASPNAPAP